MNRENTGLKQMNRNESRPARTKEHAKVYEMLKESSLDWTIICPTYLPDGTATGVYRTERNVLPEGGTSISVGDTADFLYRELVTGEYVGYRVGLAY